MNNVVNNEQVRTTAGVSFAATICFDKVDVELGNKKILNKLDLKLKPAEIVCLLGESGSGKSTILRVIAGLQAVKSGSLKINDEIVSDKKKTLEPQKRGVGLMFQDFALFPHLTLFENVVFGLSHLKKDKAKQQAEVALARVGLEKRKNDYPNMLSGGQQQRLALARTIAPRPSIIMLDEPFSGLDSRLRQSIRADTLAVLRETNATTIIVTHDPEEAMLLGDRVIMLKNGRVSQIDSPKNIYNKPNDIETARFIAPLNEIEAVVNNGFANTLLGKVPTRDFKENDKVIIAFRSVGAVKIEEKPNKTNKTARIISKKNALGFDVYQVQVAGIEQTILIKEKSNPQLCVGKNIYISLNLKHVLVFDQK